ncbi:low molecular weight protein-tyrosine-phosphatase [Cohaesibacter sp. CAU 1516]|uniref:low molecular weight protein-tyrosine-phosphatase n=1 Tax=Cohaesibacter sp. CAU 1516 TaxID=2576038 RepID=UPI001FEF189F|nr:low molecular weight protein-tyrosine-phosphatase [Cohaesibacter sp. CAU 1516]
MSRSIGGRDRPPKAGLTSMARGIQSILFVCLGNICRSPLAEGVMRHKLQLAGLGEQVRLDSCGTGPWHVGNPPDRRSVGIARQHGIAMDDLRARKVRRQDFYEFELILAMDRDNLADLQAIQPRDGIAELALYLDYCEVADDLGFDEVPDPYYGGDRGFGAVYAMIDRASNFLVARCR